MKNMELKTILKNLKRECSKDVLKEALNIYGIKGIKDTINSDIIILESDNENEYNIACNSNDSFYLLHGEYGDFSRIKKCQIKEEPNVKIDDSGYKEDYITKVNLTEYEDHLLGIVVREEQFNENIALKEKIYNCSMVMTKTNSNKFVLPHEVVSEKLQGLDVHMYDYNNWNDPVLREWYIENFVDYFTNNGLDIKLHNILNEQNKVLKKEKK